MSGVIYGLVDENNEVFYIGKTINQEKRLKDHIRSADNKRRFRVNNKIKSIIKKGYKPDMVIIEECSDEQIDDRERYYIAEYRKTHPNLCNMADGGEGGCNPEAAKKIIATKLKNGTNKMSDETKQKMSLALKDKPKSNEHKMALSKAWKRTPEQLALSSAKAAKTSKGKINIGSFICTSPDGIEYETPEGLTKFCEEHNLCSSNMGIVARGKKQYYMGWSCRYADNHIKKNATDEHKANIQKALVGKANIKRFVCTSPNGEKHITESGLSEFCRQNGLSQSAMSAIAHGKGKTYKGWRCEYYE